MRAIDLSNKRFGRLVVLYPKPGSEFKDGRRRWHCRCDCGKELDVSTYNLQSGMSTSCGCYRYERAAEAARKDLTGMRFGKLIACYPTGMRDHSNIVWYCKCDCGNIVYVSSNKLLMKTTQSCGKCGFQQKRASEANTKYSSSIERHLERVLHGMKIRCYYPFSNNYHRYGGRGIKICDEWLKDPKNFIDWAISHGYKPGLDIDRMNNNGDYTPENCRFVTREENCNNKGNNKFVQVENISQSCSRWDRYFGLPPSTMCHYLSKHGEEKTKEYILKRLHVVRGGGSHGFI